MVAGMALAAGLDDGARAGVFDDGLAAIQRGDYAEAFRIFGPAAADGDVKAQYNLGLMYQAGEGVRRDDAAAAEWYGRAAEQGNPGAQFKLGRMYHDGQGVPKDDGKAAGWYLKAALQGYAAAQVDLGVMYAEGQGARRDYVRAINWYRKAADQQDAQGLFDLNLMYAEVAKRYPQAVDGGGAVSPPDDGWSTGERPQMSQEQFRAMMDAVFGPGRWRETGGYRSPAREDQLREDGAETVPAGVLSRHSLGTPDAPGAYDIVVDGLSPEAAAADLRRSGAQFTRLFPEAAHGGQGPHLHVEPDSTVSRIMASLSLGPSGSQTGVRPAETDMAVSPNDQQAGPRSDDARVARWYGSIVERSAAERNAEPRADWETE